MHHLLPPLDPPHTHGRALVAAKRPWCGPNREGSESEPLRLTEHMFDHLGPVVKTSIEVRLNRPGITGGSDS